MEFIINKIDTDVRNKIQEEIKADKVHSGKAINVNRDLTDAKKEAYEKSNKNASTKKRYITINGIKDFEEKIAVEVEKTENIDEENSKGRVLDSKK